MKKTKKKKCCTASDKIVTKIFKFFATMQKEFGTNGFTEEIAFCCLVNFLKESHGKTRLREIFKEEMSRK